MVLNASNFLRTDVVIMGIVVIGVVAYLFDLLMRYVERLVVPWKYGFKGIKAIVKVKFVDKMPPTTWNIMASNEYGFYSNVNPNVDHPRWSQAKERRIGEFFKRETLMFNGYGDQVASLYNGMDLKKYF